jgi:hypothetical protein
MLDTFELCRKSGLPVEIITGGSTGTYNIDTENHLTELQAGSYIFMDTLYRNIGGKNDEHVYNDFEPALSVLTTVISKTHPNKCAVDYGNKALLRTTDEVKGRPGVKVESGGAEYGMLLWNDGDRDIKLAERVEIYPSNLDTSTNVYDRYYVVRGESVVDVWPIMGRTGRATISNRSLPVTARVQRQLRTEPRPRGSGRWRDVAGRFSVFRTRANTLRLATPLALPSSMAVRRAASLASYCTSAPSRLDQ